MIKIDGIKVTLYDKRTLTETNRSVMRVFIKAAAYTRTVARNSIKSSGKKNKPSSPGSPPKSRTGYLKRNILFWPDRKNLSVKIGPAVMSGTKSNEIPGVLEEGGMIDGIRYEKRPYMNPALEKAKARLISEIRS